MGYTNKKLQAFFCSAIVLLVLGLLANFALARPLDDQKALPLRERHYLWMQRHGRIYKDEQEKEDRFQNFKTNVERIENFNANASSHNKLFKLRLNAFADLSTEEFAAIYTGYKKRPIKNNTMMSKNLAVNNKNIPPSIDWVQRGAVTRVKDQGPCGCCWAFSAVGAVEGMYQIKTGKLVSLSEQELLDCAESHGCRGGEMTRAFSYIINNQGMSKENEYPYEANRGQCYGGKSVPLAMTQYYGISEGDEDALMHAVVQQPVSVGVDATGFEMMFHGEGFFNGACSSSNDAQNHAVTLVGYGTSKEGTKYWLLKNSWGQTWGEGGYIKIVRGENKCGIANNAVFPTLQ